MFDTADYKWVELHGGIEFRSGKHFESYYLGKANFERYNRDYHHNIPQELLDGGEFYTVTIAGGGHVFDEQPVILKDGSWWVCFYNTEPVRVDDLNGLCTHFNGLAQEGSVSIMEVVECALHDDAEQCSACNPDDTRRNMWQVHVVGSSQGLADLIGG